MKTLIRQPDYFCLPALFFLLLSLALATLIIKEKNRNHALQLVTRNVALADAETDHQSALNRYQQLDLDNPLLKVRIMRRQWLLSLAAFAEKQELKKDSPESDEKSTNLDKKLDSLIFTLQQEGEALVKQKLSPEVAWRAHNLLGASRLLQAAEILARGSDPEPSQACLNLAIDHFKQAITGVDKDPDARDMGNIPRWNLELLSTDKSLSKITRSQAGVDRKLNLKRNLATMLPESAGYMVGEPPDNRVRK